MPEELPTARLVSGAQAGDEAARSALYERYFQRVLAIVRVRMGSRLRSRMDSQDLVQSVMLESLKDLGRFEYRTEGAFLRWLGLLVERKIRDKADYLGAQKRDVAREAGPQEEARDPAARSPSRIASQAEDLLRLEEAIGRLPPEQAELVLMSKLEGLSYEEIAGITGRTPGAVRMAVSRAIVDLSMALSG